MSPRILFAATCWSMLVLAKTPCSHAFPQAPAPADDKKLSRETKLVDYAATRAFRESMTSYSYAMPEEKVREVVLNWLRKDASPPPKNMPGVPQLQGDLNLNFEEAWTKMINDAAAGLDPDGKLDVARRLRDSLLETPKWRNDAKMNHDDLLKNELPKALERVKESLVQEQKTQLIEALKSVVSTDMPGQELVREAVSGDQGQATKVLTDAVRGRLSEELLGVMIVESFEALSQAADGVVSDGVMQFKQQLESLDNQPEAVSRTAIEKEIEGRLRKLADTQQAARAEDALRPGYGVFTWIEQEIPAKSRFWFDRGVARVGDQILEEVALLKRPLPSEDERTLRQLILANLAAHHQPEASMQAAQPTIQEMLKRGQQWIVEELVQVFRQSGSPADQEYSEDRLRAEVADIMQAVGTRAHESSSKLRQALRTRYERDVLPALRRKIADEQARQYAPLLMTQGWTPAEDLLNVPLPLQSEILKDLRIWSNGPPQPENRVLLETWELWTKAAQDALAMLHQALDGQLRIVEDLKESIGQEIARDPDRSREKWVAEFSRRATRAWQTGGAGVARTYPQLFARTVDRIKQIVAEILPAVDDAPSQELPAEPEMKEEPKLPPVTDADAPAIPAPEEPPPAVPPSEEPAATGSPEKREGTEETAPRSGLEGAAAPDEKGGSAETGEGQTGEGTEDGAEANEEGLEGDAQQEEDVDEGEGDGSGGGKKSKRKGLGSGEEEEVSRPLASRIVLTPRTYTDWFYRIGFWVLLILVLVMAVCWHFHVRHYKRRLAQYRRALPLDRW